MLGKWALLDIETSGVDPTQDSVIDLGFVLYEGTELKSEHSIRFKYDQSLDPIIIALTGLTIPELETQGSTWNQSLETLKLLDGAVLIAHNASFEESFLKTIFQEYEIHPCLTDQGLFFHDSLEVFPFLLPYFPRLGLEAINQIFKIQPKENHQGLYDAKDLAEALFYAHEFAGPERRAKLMQMASISSWWKKWLATPLTQKHPVQEFDVNNSEKIKKWEQAELLQYSKQFGDKNLEWLSLKIIQMLGRNISGIVSPTQATSRDLRVIADVASNYVRFFPEKTLCLCSSYFSPDEQLWFLKDLDAITVDGYACREFMEHAKEFSALLNTDAQVWSKELMNFYAEVKPVFGIASRVPDLWCRKEPIVEMLWSACKTIARKKIRHEIKNKMTKMLILSPADLSLLKEKENVVTLFWQSKQLEWNADVSVAKLRLLDIEQVQLVCQVLRSIDAENAPTIEAAELLFDEFNKSIGRFIQQMQSVDHKRLYWDVDFSDFSQKHLQDWKSKTHNFISRREHLKNYQSPLQDALWSRVDEVLMDILNASSSNSYGLSWRSQSEKVIWEMWRPESVLRGLNGGKIFFDYEFDPNSSVYWGHVLGLESMEKSKRFEKIQRDELALNAHQFNVSVWDDTQVPKIANQILELSKVGKVLFCSQDLSLSTNVYSHFIKTKSLSVATWSQFMRDKCITEANVIFCWEKEVRLESLLRINPRPELFSAMIIDRVPDLAWFAWAQSAWKQRVGFFEGSSFDAYWSRRSSIMREKYWPLVRSCRIGEVIVFDSRKNKWKGDSWKILKSHLLP